jgi:hypothetical protein
MNQILNELRPGDLLTCKKNVFISHVGVYLGLGQILQNTPGRGEHVVDWNSFADGRAVTIRHTNTPPHLVAQRASQLLRQARPYNPIFNNCEHTASAVIDGFRVSGQVILWGLIGFFAVRALSRG